MKTPASIAVWVIEVCNPPTTKRVTTWGGVLLKTPMASREYFLLYLCIKYIFINLGDILRIDSLYNTTMDIQYL